MCRAVPRLQNGEEQRQVDDTAVSALGRPEEPVSADHCLSGFQHLAQQRALPAGCTMHMAMAAANPTTTLVTPSA